LGARERKREGGREERTVRDGMDGKRCSPRERERRENGRWGRKERKGRRKEEREAEREVDRDGEEEMGRAKER
jgi:hypothetical protein